MESAALSVKFLSHLEKIKALKSTDIKEINQMIDEINLLFGQESKYDHLLIEDLVCTVSKLIPGGNDHLLSKFSNLIYYIIRNQKVTFSRSCLQCLVPHIIAALQSCGDWVKNDVLVALSAVLYENVDNIEQFHEALIGPEGILIKLTVPSVCDLATRYNALLCLQSLLTKSSGEIHLNEDLLRNCFEKCLYILKETSIEDTSNIIPLRILICALKCLQLIFSSKSLCIRNIGELLGSLKKVLFLGLPGQNSLTDSHLYPTLMCPGGVNPGTDSLSESDTSYPKLRKQKKNKRSRSKKKSQKKESEISTCNEGEMNANLNTSINGVANHSLPSPSNKRPSRFQSSSSDSEFSEAENHISKVKSLQASARKNAYQALQAVVKVVDRKLIFGYWSSFLPDYPAIPGGLYGHNIFTTILKDPISQVRLSALALVTEMLRGSKQFLSFADGRGPVQKSFTSLSSVLASMLKEIHRCLLLALLSENSAVLLTQILKCYAILLESSPYKKLDKDILPKLIKHMASFLHFKDTQVQVACLTAFGSLMNSDQIPEEVIEIMLSSRLDGVDETFHENPSGVQMPWILDVCKRNVFNKEPMPVRLESLQLLSIVVGKYFSKVYVLISYLEEMILFCLNEVDTSLQLHGAKLLEVIGRCISSSVKPVDAPILESTISTLWQKILPKPLIPCLTNENQKTLQSVCCDCLSTIPSTVFEELPAKHHVTCITLLLGLTSDCDPNVRGAAIRCLGVYTLFPCLTQDLCFLSDVSEILIKAVKDSNVNVRYKASWALGNLSDSLFMKRDPSCLDKDISVQFFYSTGMACVQFSKDSDRLKANAVRALGNFLRCLPSTYLAKPVIHEFVREASRALKSNISTTIMKVCWNACYAIGNTFTNMPLVESKLIAIDEFLDCLLSVLNSPNFKVRISVVQALVSLPDRKYYGNLFPEIWLRLLASLYSASADVNFKEMRHQENLRSQIIYSLCVLSSLTTSEDLIPIFTGTFEASEMLSASMQKFGSTATENKIEAIHKAREHLSELADTLGEGDEFHLLLLLKNILTQAITAHEHFEEAKDV